MTPEPTRCLAQNASPKRSQDSTSACAAPGEGGPAGSGGSEGGGSEGWEGWLPGIDAEGTESWESNTGGGVRDRSCPTAVKSTFKRGGKDGTRVGGIGESSPKMENQSRLSPKAAGNTSWLSSSLLLHQLHHPKQTFALGPNERENRQPARGGPVPEQLGEAAFRGVVPPFWSVVHLFSSERRHCDSPRIE